MKYPMATFVISYVLGCVGAQLLFGPSIPAMVVTGFVLLAFIGVAMMLQHRGRRYSRQLSVHLNETDLPSYCSHDGAIEVDTKTADGRVRVAWWCATCEKQLPANALEGELPLAPWERPKLNLETVTEFIDGRWVTHERECNHNGWRQYHPDYGTRCQKCRKILGPGVQRSPQQPGLTVTSYPRERPSDGGVQFFG
jgi:hypothetical protein